MAKKSAVSRSKKVKAPAGEKTTGKQAIYQFKISLRDFKPLIWRRIQVQNCTLGKLHEHIQTAMGWTNSHLHQFRIGEQYYGDPKYLEGTFEEEDFRDSTKTMLSDIVPADGMRFSFLYEYDFGDSWRHEIRFEKIVEPEAGSRYPVCTEGERACPPEDCGGVWGYANLLETIASPTHEDHESMLEWLGGSFDPEAFDPAKATREMKKGLIGW